MDLGVSVQEVNGVPVVACKGELDLHTVPTLRQTLLDYLSAPLLVIDLNELDFIDFSGLGVLIGTLKKVRSNGGELVIVCTQPRILEILSITGVSRNLSVFDKVEDVPAKDNV